MCQQAADNTYIVCMCTRQPSCTALLLPLYNTCEHRLHERVVVMQCLSSTHYYVQLLPLIIPQGNTKASSTWLCLVATYFLTLHLCAGCYWCTSGTTPRSISTTHGTAKQLSDMVRHDCSLLLFAHRFDCCCLQPQGECNSTHTHTHTLHVPPELKYQKLPCTY